MKGFAIFIIKLNFSINTADGLILISTTSICSTIRSH